MRKFIRKLFIMITDIICLIVLFYFTLFIRQNLDTFHLPTFDILKLYDFSFIIFIIFSLLYLEKIYTFRYDFWQDTLKVIRSLVVGFLLTLSFLALSHSTLEYSRVFLLLYFSMGIVFIPIAKRYIKKFLFQFDFFTKKILVVGGKEQKELFKTEIQNNFYFGQKYSEESYESVIIVSEGLQISQFNALIEKYLDKHSELFVVPYVTNINFAHSNIQEYANIHLNTIQIQNKLLTKHNIYIKNISDKLLSVIALPFFVPLHFLISLLIRLDSQGKSFFKQERLGKDEKNFFVYKYRTMYEDSAEILESYLEEFPDEQTYYKKFHKYKNDPRITPIGKFLRATSLDELPQLLNVLKGEMSIVGPRPYMLCEKEKLHKHKHFILKVKPGITGLWQVSGRNNLTFKERNELEVWYIKNWSLWADFVILIKTIKVVILKVGAK